MKNTIACPLWLYKVFPFLRWWPMVDKSTTKSDLIAGLTGAMIVLPQGVAFATIAGLPPEFGLYAAMVPAIIGAMFGSSWHLVSGPTTAISIAVFASVSPYAEPGSAQYISLVLTLTFMAGLFQLIMGLARMGVLVNFISHTVVIGFTAGAAVLIAGSQIKNFLGLQMARGLPFHEVLQQVYLQFDKINPYVTTVGVVTLVSGMILKKYMPKLFMILAMVIGSVAALIINQMYGGADVTHIKTVGALSASLPPLTHPDLSLVAIKQVLFPSLIVTMLALTEAVSISRAIAVKSEQRIDGNQEFIGQGLSNIFGSFFSSYASSGSFNRSGVNYAAGAKTPFAAVFSSVFLVVILILVASLAAYLPTAAMAGILFLVAYALIDFHHIHSILHTSRQETAILAVTLIGTLVDLEKGIFLGIMLSLMLYLYRTSRPEVVTVVPDTEPDSYHYVPVNGSPECPQLKILRVHGSVFFGAVNHVQQTLLDVDEYNPQQKSLLLASSGMSFVDIAGAEMLVQEARRRKKIGGGLYFYRMQKDVHDVLVKGEYMKDIGEENSFPAKSRPIDTIYPKLDSEICRNCTARIFAPCHITLPNGEPRK
ncbi:MAG: SulP family inorganic anion transporter [Sulfuriferula sp.]